MDSFFAEHKNGYLRCGRHNLYLTSSSNLKETRYLKERTHLTSATNRLRIRSRLSLELSLFFLFIGFTYLFLPLLIVFPGIFILTPIAIARLMDYYKADFNCIFFIPYSKILLITISNSKLIFSFENGNFEKDEVLIQNLKQEDIDHLMTMPHLSQIRKEYIK